LVSVCEPISVSYEIHFLEIGTDKNHVQFLDQSVPSKSVSSLVKMIKSITTRELFKLHPKVKKYYGRFILVKWIFVNTVSRFGYENSITKHVRNQGLEKEYGILHKSQSSYHCSSSETPYGCIGEFILKPWR